MDSSCQPVIRKTPYARVVPATYCAMASAQCMKNVIRKEPAITVSTQGSEY